MPARREICYWLLTGPHGGEIAAMRLANSHAQQVVAAMYVLRERFAEPVRIQDLANMCTDERLGVPSNIQRPSRR
jgi:hypothetical protein